MCMINAEALMEAYHNTPKELQTWNHAWVLINRAKLAQPKRKTGKWIDEGHYADGHGFHAYCCSECEGHIIEYEPYPFCPWCGSDMRGNDNEDN